MYLNKAFHGGGRSFQACESQRLIEEGLHGKVREENPHEREIWRGVLRMSVKVGDDAEEPRLEDNLSRLRWEPGQESQEVGAQSWVSWPWEEGRQGFLSELKEEWIVGKLKTKQASKKKNMGTYKVEYT